MTSLPISPLPFSAIHVDSPPVIPTLTTSYAHGTSSTSLLHSTIPEILQWTVDRHPDREAMAFPQDGVRKTFSQFQQDVSATASFLKREKTVCTLLFP